MSGLGLRVLCVWAQAHFAALENAAPLPLFLEEYDSTGVKWWGCAKNIIRWGLAGSVEVFSEWLNETR